MGKLVKESKEMIRYLFTILFLVFSFGHVGNPSIVYEGNAGEYPIRVVIRPPGVVPGLAEIFVHSLDGKITEVKTQPMKWNAGVEGSPPADVANPMFDQPDKFTSELWLMDFGSYSINVDVDGKLGKANAVVPVLSIATKRSEMNPIMKNVLMFLMALLIAGFVTIIGASIAESTLEQGIIPDERRAKKSKIFMGFALLFCIGVIFGGKKWWNNIADIYYSNLFKPMDTKSEIFTNGDVKVVSLEITDPLWKNGRYTPLVPDHGKLIHSYYLKDDLSVFGHVHPIINPENADRFDLALPKDLQNGIYYIYSDVTHETGFSQTLLDTVNITDNPSSNSDFIPKTDPDNSWMSANSQTDFDKSEFVFSDNSKMKWDNFESKINPGFVDFNFHLVDENNHPLPLQAYIEMGGHGIIFKKDGTQFIHIHPTGNFSMASQEVLYELKEGVEINPQELFCTFGFRNEDGKLVQNLNEDGRVTFPPFEFRESGEYRIWIQVKTSGNVKTATFDLNVIESNAEV